MARARLLRPARAGVLVLLAVSIAATIVVACNDRPVFPIEDDADGAAPLNTPDGTREGAAPISDASQPTDARSDAKSDASEAAAPPTASCADLLPVVCDFDGNCHPWGGLGGSSIFPNFELDAGLDGSKALGIRAYDGDGGLATLALPVGTTGDDGFGYPSFAGCRVTCEVDLRVERGAHSNAELLSLSGSSGFTLLASDGGFLQVGTTASAPGPRIDGSWVHVRIEAAPSTGGGASGAITYTDVLDASVMTSVPMEDIRNGIRIGGNVPVGGETFVYHADNLWCDVSE